MARLALMIVCAILQGFAIHAQDDPTSLYSMAEEFLENEQRDSAIVYAEKGRSIMQLAGDTLSPAYAKFSFIIGLAYAKRYRCEEAQPYFHHAIGLLEDDPENEHTLARCYLRSAACHKDFNVKIAFQDQALDIFLAEGDSLNIAMTCLDLGITHRRMGNIELTRSITLLGIQYLNGMENTERYQLRLDFSLGRYYAGIANNDAAIFYMSKAHDLLLRTAPEDPVHFNIARDLANLLIEEGRYDEAIPVLQAPILPDTVYKSSHRLGAEADLWYDLGDAYAGIGDSKMAEDALLKGLSCVEPRYDETYIYLAYPYQQLAEFYLGQEDRKSCKFYLDKFNEVVSINTIQHHPDYGMLNLYGARILVETGDLEIARERIDNGLAGLGYDPSNPVAFEEVYRYDLVADLINLRTQVLFQIHGSDLSGSPQYVEQIDAHLIFLDTMQNQKLDPAAMIHILEDHFHLYEKAVQLKEIQYTNSGDEDLLTEALLISEKSKDQLFSQFLLNNRIRTEYDIPEDLLIEEKQLNKTIADLEVSIFNTPKEDSLLHSDLRRRQLEAQLALENVMIEINQPFSMVASDITPTQILKDLQSNLGHDQAVIEFFSGDKQDHLFIITSEGSGWLTVDGVDIPDRLIASLKNYRTQESWMEDSRDLMNLLTPAIASLPEQIEQLIIIPDGKWSYIPFEVLPSPEGSYEFLVERYAISYANSIKSLYQLRQKKSSASRRFAAFAPDYTTLRINEEDTSGTSVYAELVRSGEYALPGAAVEASSVAGIMNGQTYSADAASKAIFKREAPRYKILHLSMHALMEEENPDHSRLIFTQTDEPGSDHYLFASELTRMQLNAEMAVLSACNTGTGKTIKGEGVMSLSRAFNYAGVASTVHSLWKVPDAATAELMVYFYNELRDGNDKATALRNAKLKYLENAAAEELRHPYYWAGFVAHGSTAPLSSAPFPWGRYAIPLVIALFTVLLVGWRRVVGRSSSV